MKYTTLEEKERINGKMVVFSFRIGVFHYPDGFKDVALPNDALEYVQENYPLFDTFEECLDDFGKERTEEITFDIRKRFKFPVIILKNERRVQ